MLLAGMQVLKRRQHDLTIQVQTRTSYRVEVSGLIVRAAEYYMAINVA